MQLMLMFGACFIQIERDTEDLEEMVKYLELEQQFSTKHSKVTECFRERKTEQYILSPKKAYNICKFYINL